jgi:hypothetical protein
MCLIMISDILVSFLDFRYESLNYFKIYVHVVEAGVVSQQMTYYSH